MVARSARTVDIRPMLDTEHDDSVVHVVDLVDDTERAPPGAVDAFEFPLQLLAHAVRVLQQCAGNELDHRSGDSFGELVFDDACDRTGHPQ